MPMIDAFIPENALTPQAEQQLFREVTDLVIKHEIGDLANERARHASWLSLHRPAVFVGGAPAAQPRYRFIVSVPEGQFDAQRRQAITVEITAARPRHGEARQASWLVRSVAGGSQIMNAPATASKAIP